MSLIVITQPTIEPITLDEMRQHLRVDFTDDDAVITNIITAARQNLEHVYRIACITQTLELGLDYFGQADYQWDIFWPVGWWPPSGWGYPLASSIDLRPPLQSVTSVKYIDPGGVLQTFASTNYQVDTASFPGRIAPAIGKLWPVTSPVPAAVQIRFVAGYADAASTPSDMKQAIKLIGGVLYENREQALIGSRLSAVELPYGVQDLMGSYYRPLVR